MISFIVELLRILRRRYCTDWYWAVVLIVCLWVNGFLWFLIDSNFWLAGAEDWWRRFRWDLRRHRSGDARTGRPETGVGQATETGPQDGGGRSQTPARFASAINTMNRPQLSKDWTCRCRQGTRVPFHRLRQERPVQLCGDAAAGAQPGRTEAGPAEGRLLSVDQPASGPADPQSHRKHSRSRFPPSGRQTRESLTAIRYVSYRTWCWLTLLVFLHYRFIIYC